MRFLRFVSLLTVLVVFGCDSSKEKRFEVTGKVSLDGEPINEGTISFDVGDGAVPGNGQIQGGVYKLQAKPGKNKVVIRAFKVDPNIKESTDPVRPISNKVNFIPDIYNDKTTLHVEVGDKKNHDFELTTPKKTDAK